ncbi:putative transcriptional regulator, TetR family [Streptosporangium roseum DSM 43021]|uniref:Transcriptional regulator, TetR family n=1 Tax=Streptosporangium roseum (strain ATCC 12428 / DSM 43021 / JCM 3005 / KCTC 9067 / NCIMB 10171 / NRRL 2505 / NI 9100) TaxID=479432 RepID=D2AUS1_STRRD|nr:putative transcriptional regulator, TetR family [Streptosporangium roseum DSM 43021]
MCEWIYAYGVKQHFSSVWTRESRPAKSTALSRDQIVRAAMELLDTEGLDALSMRRLGARLGSGATSIYWHVANKDELLELVMDEVFGKVALPDPSVVGWRDAVSMFAHGLRAALFEHPWSVALIGTRPSLGPNAMEISSRLLRTFSLAGFEGMALDYASSALMSYVLGVTTPEIAWRAAMAGAELSDEGLMAGMKSAVDKAAADHPELAARYAEYAGEDPGTSRELNFDFGLTCILDGLQERLRQASMEPRATRPGPATPHEARSSEA